MFIALYINKIWKLLKDKIQKYDPLLESLNFMSSLSVICYYLVLLLEMSNPLVKSNRWFMFCSLVIWSSIAIYNVL
jgi:hypothetical protein